MDLIDEVIGYAKANSEAAKNPDERATWAAHHRNCVRIKGELDSEREGRTKLADALSQKDAAMGVLFERLAKAGVDCSDLVP